MFSLREVCSTLPPDESTRFVLVSNVASPMAAGDVKELFPKAVRWVYTSSVMRTDFVAEFETKAAARQAMWGAKGLSYLGRKLDLCFVQREVGCEGCPLNTTKTTTLPSLYYTLPENATFAGRLENARKMCGSLEVRAPLLGSWVDC